MDFKTSTPVKVDFVSCEPFENSISGDLFSENSGDLFLGGDEPGYVFLEAALELSTDIVLEHPSGMGSELPVTMGAASSTDIAKCNQ